MVLCRISLHDIQVFHLAMTSHTSILYHVVWRKFPKTMTPIKIFGWKQDISRLVSVGTRGEYILINLFVVRSWARDQRMTKMIWLNGLHQLIQIVPYLFSLKECAFISVPNIRLYDLAILCFCRVSSTKLTIFSDLFIITRWHGENLLAAVASFRLKF